jgi:hypothetical protein
MIFRTYRYGPDYPGLSGQDLTPGNLIELNSSFTNCDIFQAPVGVDGSQAESNMAIYPNPATDGITISSSEPYERLEVFDATGRRMIDMKPRKLSETISIANWPTGVYSAVLS